MRHTAVKIGRITFLVGIIALAPASAVLAGTPLLGPDCGVGASVVGTDAVGKVTLGTPDESLPSAGTCTLTFSVSYTNPPTCTANNETNGGGFPAPYGARTTHTTLVVGSSTGAVPGDVISYSCADY